MDLEKVPPDIRERLPDWKNQFGEVFLIPSPMSAWFVLRTFTLGEFERYQIQVTVDSEKAAEALIKACLLWPENFDLDELKVKDMKILLDKLREVSPYDNSQRFISKLEEYRKRSESLVDALYTHLCAAFPGLTIADIRAMPCDEVLHHLAVAETILGRKLEISGPGVQSLPSNLSPRQLEQLKRAKIARAKREEALRRRAEAMGGPPPEPAPSAAEASDEAPPRLSLLQDAEAMRRA
jgi:hypothetical protein